MKTQKASLNKKNTLLSNRMVEMEESRETERQTTETEQLQRKECELQIVRKDGEWKNKVIKKEDLLKHCNDASTQREKMLLDALEDVRLESLDYNAQTDIVLAKLNYLKEKLKTTTLEYVAFQNKYSDMEKEKMRLEEISNRSSIHNKGKPSKPENTSNENPQSEADSSDKSKKTTKSKTADDKMKKHKKKRGQKATDSSKKDKDGPESKTVLHSKKSEGRKMKGDTSENTADDMTDKSQEATHSEASLPEVESSQPITDSPQSPETEDVKESEHPSDVPQTPSHVIDIDEAHQLGNSDGVGIGGGVGDVVENGVQDKRAASDQPTQDMKTGRKDQIKDSDVVENESEETSHEEGERESTKVKNKEEKKTKQEDKKSNDANSDAWF